jgi:hypothetical protein
MILKELLQLASIQDEYQIVNAITKEVNVYRDGAAIPKNYDNMKVVKLYGYNAEGYDGLEIFLE